MPLPFNRSYRKLVQKNRAKGLPTRVAQQKARETLTRFEETKSLKQALGTNSAEAFVGAKQLPVYQRIQRYLQKKNPESMPTIGEAQFLHDLYRDPSARVVLRKRLPFKQFLNLYAQVREPLQGTASDSARVQRNARRAFEKSKLPTRQLAIAKKAVGGVFYSVVHPSFQGVSETRFLRAWKEGTLHRSETQRQLLETVLMESIRVWAKPRRGAPKGDEAIGTIEKAVRKLKGPVGQELLARIRARDPQFDQRPEPVKQRIIQEARANALGEMVANLLWQNITGNRAVTRAIEEDYGTRQARPPFEKANPYSFRDWGDATPYLQQWVLQQLARPGNKKFLAQKTIEWLRKE